MINDQPPPSPSSGDIWQLVIADMEARRQVGIERYGTPLQAGNGRKALVDAYQEALDLVVYLRQEIEERTSLLSTGASQDSIEGGDWKMNEHIGYDELLAARVKQLRDIDDLLERLEAAIKGGCVINLAEIQNVRFQLSNMIRVAEAEHAAF